MKWSNTFLFERVLIMREAGPESRLCIIPCGSRKIWDKGNVPEGAYRADQVYIGALHRKCQAYAKLFFPRWVILSAKHGFLDPQDLISGNYNLAFGTKDPDIISIEALQALSRAKGLAAYKDIVVLGGKKFMTLVPHVFANAAIAYPLVGSQGIGHMLQRLDRAVMTNQEL